MDGFAEEQVLTFLDTRPRNRFPEPEMASTNEGNISCCSRRDSISITGEMFSERRAFVVVRIGLVISFQ